MSLILVAVFFGLMVAGMPVGFALVMAGSAAVLTMGADQALLVIVKLFDPTQSFPLLAIPFFILSGGLMMSGRLGQRLVDFAAALVGRYQGGLAQVSVVGSTVFGGVSGSAVAEASALGSMLIPWQKREGYPPAFAAAVTASSSVIAGLIPPSIPLIIYATVSNTSIAALFTAGILPGLMLASGLMVVCYLSGRLRGFPLVQTPGGALRAAAYAAPALLMPLAIVMMLRTGVATPTEVSVLAVAYALIVSAVIYRDLTLARVYAALRDTGIATGVVLIVIMGSSLVGYVLTIEHIPQTVARWALDTLGHWVLVVIAINILMLVIGMFLDLPAAILLLGPTLVSVGQAVGLDPVQLGIVVAVNLSIGLFTPPIGTTLFISSSIARVPIGAVVRELWPFYLVGITVLVLMSFVPALTLY
jgi:tripartite ATP-independent transporter DctM subunit